MAYFTKEKQAQSKTYCYACLVQDITKQQQFSPSRNVFTY